MYRIVSLRSAFPLFLRSNRLPAEQKWLYKTLEMGEEKKKEKRVRGPHFIIVTQPLYIQQHFVGHAHAFYMTGQSSPSHPF